MSSRRGRRHKTALETFEHDEAHTEAAGSYDTRSAQLQHAIDVKESDHRRHSPWIARMRVCLQRLGVAPNGVVSTLTALLAAIIIMIITFITWHSGVFRVAKKVSPFSNGRILAPLPTALPTPASIPVPFPDWAPRVRKVVKGNQVVYFPVQGVGRRITRAPTQPTTAPPTLAPTSSPTHRPTTPAPTPLPATLAAVAFVSPRRTRGLATIDTIRVFGERGKTNTLYTDPSVFSFRTPRDAYPYAVWDAFPGANGTAAIFIGNMSMLLKNDFECVFHRDRFEEPEIALDELRWGETEAAGRLVRASMAWQPMRRAESCDSFREDSGEACTIFYCAVPSYFYTRGYSLRQHVFVSMRSVDAESNRALVANTPIERPAYDRSVEQSFFCAWTLTRNDGALIIPWIEYHLSIGVSHFFVYDAGSTDDTVVRLISYVRRGIVTVVDWSVTTLPVVNPKKLSPTQRRRMRKTALWHAMAKYGHTCKWLAPIRTDEFYSMGGRDGDSLESALLPFEHGAVAKEFEVLHLSTMMWGEQTLEALQAAIKADAGAVLLMEHMHHREASLGTEVRVVLRCANVNLWRRRMWYPFEASGNDEHSRSVSDGTLRVNHYAWRSPRSKAIVLDKSLSFQHAEAIRSAVASEFARRSGANLVPSDRDVDDLVVARNGAHLLHNGDDDELSDGIVHESKSAEVEHSADVYENSVDTVDILDEEDDSSGVDYVVHTEPDEEYDDTDEGDDTLDTFDTLDKVHEVPKTKSIQQRKKELDEMHARIMQRAIQPNKDAAQDGEMRSRLGVSSPGLKQLLDWQFREKRSVTVRTANRVTEHVFVSIDTEVPRPPNKQENQAWVDKSVPVRFKSTNHSFEELLDGWKHCALNGTPRFQPISSHGHSFATRMRANGTKHRDVAAMSKLGNLYGGDYWTVWDVFTRVNTHEVVVFMDKHFEFREAGHHFNCTIHVFDMDGLRSIRITSGALIGGHNSAPETVFFCKFPKKLQKTVLSAIEEWPNFPHVPYDTSLAQTRAFLTLQGAKDKLVLKHIPLMKNHVTHNVVEKYKLVAWSMVHNVETLIVPWIEFNLMQGVQHFFIYDHNCTDETIERLDTYARRGLVSVVDWRIDAWHKRTRMKAWSLVQMDAMNHFLKRFGAMSEWAYMGDVDEFAFSEVASEARMVDVVKFYSNTCYSVMCGALRMRCMFFGGGRAKLAPQQLLIDKFRVRDPIALEQGYEKLIVRTAGVDMRVNIHSLVNEPIIELDSEVLVHNHYWWDRPRAESTIEDNSMYERYGARLQARVDNDMLMRSSATSASSSNVKQEF